MTDKEKMKVGRLAFRVEGHWWNCYWYKHQHSTDDAVLLGSIRLTLVHSSMERKQLFMELMKDAFAEMLHDGVGQAPTFEEERAPENERAGRG